MCFVLYTWALTTPLCFVLICKQTFDCAPLFLSVLSSSSCSSMAVSKLEPELRDSIRSQYGDSIRHVYFNKGLWGQEGWLEFSIRRTRLNSCVLISWPKSVIISHNEMLLCSFFFHYIFKLVLVFGCLLWDFWSMLSLNSYSNHNSLDSCWETKWSTLRNSTSE